MLFNSFDFGLFLVVVYSLYWLIGTKKRNVQNILILVSSYFFYGQWDWRFLFLLLASSLIDFYGALAIHQSSSKKWRKFYLWHNVFWNIGVLILFKYYDFFLRSFYQMLGQEFEPGTFSLMNVLIPVGLSFYTFQTLSYTIDVYRGRIEPSKKLLDFMCFASFFPQLVAGPIERSNKLLPQFSNHRSFDKEGQKDGLRRILWGLFKKIVIADNAGIGANIVFDGYQDFNSPMLFYGIFLFTVQIYCDFTGYTDIALGTARLFGFRLSENFRLPYLAKSMSEFWQRWHITLTRWFTDYLYFPLIKTKLLPIGVLRPLAIIITMLLVGLWHGPNWTFIVLGLFDGIMILLERMRLPFGKRSLLQFLNRVTRAVSLGYFIVIVAIHNLLFRAESLEQAWKMIIGISSLSFGGTYTLLVSFWTLLFVVLMVVLELWARRRVHPLQRLEEVLRTPVRWAIYYVMIFCILWLSSSKDPFIYFQF
ncbi:MBOAT family O-acyltransferase [Aureitalea marina]|uniref:Membrane-bound O-acyltransferase family protein n=1 Tax=Aureitalea marina TaxID=930804 RepID=A0A2S7KNQ6_9FLAO|nr:MBOAT family O-acyltransferase [Aureitalea marina]PQB04264.1 hypothetical protein BST85_04605 [Aureitalea marina]